jgi:tetraacyldisaccharide 4'-kinase
MLVRETVNTRARTLLAAWYDGVPAPLWARLVEPAYRAVIHLRRLAYARGWRASAHPGRPVVVIGNVAVGGTGKTPLVAWLVRALAGRGLRPAIVSRGYGGAEPREPHRVTAEDSPEFSGDEPLLLARATGVPVWICRDRLAAARAAVAAGADIIVADDGLQHYRLQRDFEIAVVDAERGVGNGRCLPAGPLREPAARLDEVDFVVCNGTGGRCPAGGLRMSLAGAEAMRLDGAGRRALPAFSDAPVHAVAGIGHPERFFRFLESHGLEVIPHPLDDHAPVPDSLLAPADGGSVLMTSKDAMRCLHRPAAATAWHVPVEACLEQDGAPLLAALAQRLGLREA